MSRRSTLIHHLRLLSLFAFAPLASSLLPAAEVAEVAAEKAKGIELGDASLTSGIPGEGPLTNDELTEWLSDPKNHAPLKYTFA
jgi:cytochrome c peroxidase